MPKERKPSAPKLTRQQVKDGLDSMPLDAVLLGAGRGEQALTPKQREFARLVAMGETKAGSYRKAFGSKGKPHTVANRGYELSQRGDVQAIIDAYQLASEAAKYRTPVQLRELVIHQLTQHALNTECPPAQRIKALELLGKVSEVAAFTERKETTIVKQSGDIKTRLLESLRNVVDVDAKEVDSDADSLLAEIIGAKQAQNSELAECEPHRTPTEHIEADAASFYIHTNLDKQSPSYLDKESPPNLNKEPVPDPDKESPPQSILDNPEQNLGEIEDERS